MQPEVWCTGEIDAQLVPRELGNGRHSPVPHLWEGPQTTPMTSARPMQDYGIPTGETVEPTITTTTEGECDWALFDRYGDPYPHGIKARRRVSGAGDLLDGLYCIRHAKLAVEWWRVGIEPVF